MGRGHTHKCSPLRRNSFCTKTYYFSPQLSVAQTKLSPSPARAHSPTVQLKDESYAYAFISVSSPKDMELVPNFDKKEDTATLMKASSCQSAINGGFLETKRKPPGVFTLHVI